jgi:voltage-gated potassium channel
MNGFRARMRSIVHDNDTKHGRIFDIAVQVFVLISVASFTIETLPNLPEKYQEILNDIETALIIIFTFEYLLRVWVAEKPLKYIFSFYGLIDLMAILPFYLSTSVDLRALRSLRFLILFRIMKLIKFTKAMNRFSKALKLAKEEIIIFLTATVIILYLSSVGIYYFENAAQPEQFASIIHSLWWSVATLTTVGYGDIYPITLGGKFFTFVILMIGLGIVGIPAGLIASALSAVRREEESKAKSE